MDILIKERLRLLNLSQKAIIAKRLFKDNSKYTVLKKQIDDAIILLYQYLIIERRTSKSNYNYTAYDTQYINNVIRNYHIDVNAKKATQRVKIYTQQHRDLTI